MTLVGVGYRQPLSSLFRAETPVVDCVELVADRYLGDNGFVRAWELRRTAGLPTIIHGLSGNVASVHGPDHSYLTKIGRLGNAVGAIIYSDHLAMTAAAGRSLGHLAPNLFDDCLLSAAATNITRMVATTGKRVCLENLATQITISGSTYTPEEFYLRLLAASNEWDCLIDLTNLWINSMNRSLDPVAFLDALPPDRVTYVHLAGGSRSKGRWIDSHSGAVHAEVFDLLDRLLERVTPAAVVIERDKNWDRAEAELRIDIDRVRDLIHKHQPRSASRTPTITESNGRS
jgi:uncharacterized protein (UPF0276 family)